MTSKQTSKQNKVNIYIAALKYGEEKLSKGVCYNEMIEHLETKGYYKKGENIFQFKEWFYLSFYCPQWAQTANQIKTGKIDSPFGFQGYKHDDLKGFLLPEELFKLYDYQELKEAREFSKRAHRTAVVAIILSGLLALGSLIIQLFNISF